MHADQLDASHYSLVCPGCECRSADDGLVLACPESHAAALLKTEYHTSEFAPDHGSTGVYRYHRWLPVRRTLPGTGRTVVYRGERLGASLGVKDLWIAFNGYWPERGANLSTGTFKELEAATVLGRIPEDAGTLVLASAGNTAAAFAELCSQHAVPVVIVVPSGAVGQLRSRTPYSDDVTIVSVEQGDYSDAIALADALAELPGFTAEGGTRNVGRRDGLGTVLLAAYEELGALPHAYVQAIGSGAGTIAVHEAAARLRGQSDGESPFPRLIVAQNATFAPVHEAWHTGRLPWTEAAEDSAEVRSAFAPELTNRRPPYEAAGGLRAALVESRGDVLVADAAEATAAMEAFLELEGIDIERPAGLALAALRTALRTGRVDGDGSILLNITGGGRARLARDHRLVHNHPDLTVPRTATHCPEQVSELATRVAPLRRQLAGI